MFARAFVKKKEKNLEGIEMIFLLLHLYVMKYSIMRLIYY